MDQVEQGLAATITFTFTAAGVATDPDDDLATVTITRSDGTVLYTDAATSHGGAGEFSYELLPADTASLDVLTLAWTATLDSVEQTFTTQVEVVGAFYFTIAEFKAAYAEDADVQALSASAIAKARITAESIIENACNVAFVPRAKRLRVSGNRTTRLDVPIYMLRSVSSVSIDGEVQDISDYRVGSAGVYRSTVWPRNVSNVTVLVTHGFDEPPPHLKEAAITLTYHRLIKSPITDRATSAPAGDAGGVITLLTPGVGNAITGIPDVDAAIIANRLPKPGSVSSVLMADASNTYPDPLEDFAIG